MSETKQNGISIDWDLANNDAAQWANSYVGQLVQGIEETTRQRIAREVQQFITNQETVGQLTSRLSGTFGEDRARMIAVTETTRAFAEGNLAAWRESGVVKGKRWRTNNDELVCPICGPLNGVVVLLDAEFEGGYESPPAHPRCRCWITPVVGEVEGPEREPGIGAPSVPSVGVQSVTAQNITSIESQAKRQAWEDSLSDKEKAALRHWGASGYDIRRYQAGDLDEWLVTLSPDEAQRIRRHIEQTAVDWKMALDKGIRYEGEIVRGLGNIPKEVADEWATARSITLRNDQSATTQLKVGETFAAGNDPAVWHVNQRSGVHLFENTSVTYGGSGVSESEVIMRQNTEYMIDGVEYRLNKDVYKNRPSWAVGDNWVFDPADYFEGTGFSWPYNQPPGWNIMNDIAGEMHLFMTEV